MTFHGVLRCFCVCVDVTVAGLQGQGSYTVKMNNEIVARGGQFASSDERLFALPLSWQPLLASGETLSVGVTVVIPPNQPTAMLTGAAFKVYSLESAGLPIITNLLVTANCAPLPSPLPSSGPSSCTLVPPSLVVTPVVINDCGSTTTADVTLSLTNNNIGCDPAPFTTSALGFPDSWSVGGFSPSYCAQLEVIISPDKYPDEISWEVRS